MATIKRFINTALSTLGGSYVGSNVGAILGLVLGGAGYHLVSAPGNRSGVNLIFYMGLGGVIGKYCGTILGGAAAGIYSLTRKKNTGKSH